MSIYADHSVFFPTTALLTVHPEKKSAQIMDIDDCKRLIGRWHFVELNVPIFI